MDLGPYLEDHNTPSQGLPGHPFEPSAVAAAAAVDNAVVVAAAGNSAVVAYAERFAERPAAAVVVGSSACGCY